MAYNNACELAVLVNGRAVKEYGHKGLTYIEGKQGSKYSLKLKNNRGNRVLAIISVDGIDVLKGRNAEEAESGYIINAYSSIDIKGYRINNDDVAEFVFSDKHGSYAKAVTKSAQNAGVIGVRFYEEKPKPVTHTTIINNPPCPTPVDIDPEWPYKPNKPWYPYAPYWSGATYSSLNSDNSISAMSFTCGGANMNMMRCADTTNTVSSVTPSEVPDFNLGTKWGQKIADPVVLTEFERGTLISEMVLYYATRKALEKIGIEFSNRKYVSHESKLPKAFGTGSFCKPPEGWSA